MKIEITKTGNVLTAGFSGELDHHSSFPAREALDRYLADGNIRYLIIELKELGFMDSSGIGILLGRYKTISERGGLMFLAGPNPRIDKLLRVAGVDRAAKIVPDTESAIKCIKGTGYESYQ